MREHREPGWLDQLLGVVGDAVGDLRTKLIDEAWFGRGPARAGSPTSSTVRSADELMPRRSFEEDWAPQAPSGAQGDRDMGIDR